MTGTAGSPAPYWEDGTVTLHLGKAERVLTTLPDASVDAVVTDPPYEISFMQRSWDSSGIAFDPALWAEVLRVLKPGGHLLAFGGTRTYHRVVCAIEDAGFQVRDSIHWIFGSGFPKSHNHLKPAHESIALARRPLVGTVAGNVLTHGTGALNIDACRIPPTGEHEPNARKTRGRGLGYHGADAPRPQWDGTGGRWPTNVVFSHPPLIVDGEVVGDACADSCVDGCPVLELDRQSGTRVSGKPGHHRAGRNNGAAYGAESRPSGTPMTGHGDSGGASRFFPVFRFEAKAPSSERPRLADGTAHQTVKPLALVRWLARLVCPPGGLILDPFAGSGTTGEAAVIEGFRALLVEKESPHAELIKARLSKPIAPVLDLS